MLEKIIEVKVNEKELKKVLKEMKLFENFKQSAQEYFAEEEKMDERLNYIKDQLQELQNKYTANLLEQETANVAEIIYLKMQTKKMKEEMDMLESILAEAQNEKQELLLNFFKTHERALQRDTAHVSQYDFTPIFTEVISQLLAVSKEIGDEARKQYKEVYPDISYFFFDDKVRERYPRLLANYTHKTYMPRFNWTSKTVLETEHVQDAIEYGRIADSFQLKEVEKDGE